MKQHLIFGLALSVAVSLSTAGCGSSDGANAVQEGAGEEDADGSDTAARDGGTHAGKPAATNPGKQNGGSTSSGGVSSTSKGDAGATKPVDRNAPAPTTQTIDPKYVNLAIPLGEPLDPSKGDTHPMADYKPPTGWNWYNIDGAKCRDGSQMGIMVHWAMPKSTNLFIYFEGGGACANPGFCELNPVNVNQQFLTGGESAVASLVILDQAQAPTAEGIFDLTNKDNPYKDWNMVYIPYCTGDVHFGAAPDGKVDGVTGPLMFVGAKNTQLIIARVAATFSDTERFIAGGSSAGGYGAGLNFGMIQDTFGAKAYGSALLDASPPFSNEYAPVCLQKRWRETWNLDANLPSDCGEQCKSADGGNLFNIVDYWRGKYPTAKIALISGIHDEIIRLFFSLGNDNCSNYGADPPSLFIGTIGATYDPDKFNAGLQDLRKRYQDTNQLATYYMDGFPNSTAHQCLFRARVYEEAAGEGKGTIASFLSKFTDGMMNQVGP